MPILGFLLVVYGIGGLIAKQFFDKDFGLFDRWFDGTQLIIVQSVAGVLGMILLAVSIRGLLAKNRNQK